MNSDFTIMSAANEDAAAIADLLAPYAQAKIVLPRTKEDILHYIGNFLVAKDAAGIVRGSIALRDFGDGLQEIRSLAVAKEYNGNGIGSKLILAAIDFAQKRQATTVFALTLRPHLFIRLNFSIVDKEEFPQKVWLDCSKCPKLAVCDETAVVYSLNRQP